MGIFVLLRAAMYLFTFIFSSYLQRGSRWCAILVQLPDISKAIAGTNTTNPIYYVYLIQPSGHRHS